MARTHEVQYQVETVRVEHARAHAQWRIFLAAGRPAALSEFERVADDLPMRLARLRALVVDNPAQQLRVDRVSALVLEDLAELRSSLQAKREGDLERPGAILGRLGQATPSVDAVADALREMLREESDLLEERKRVSSEGAHLTKLAIVFGSLLSLSMLAAAFLLILRESAGAPKRRPPRNAPSTNSRTSTTTPRAATTRSTPRDASCASTTPGWPGWATRARRWSASCGTLTS
ncbi:MAG: CHASE3 domain-containing protein [Betaproteobacteria bacterium]|nr:CHASE3 domain-containing protein [Betaproteobacteria bacterium]